MLTRAIAAVAAAVAFAAFASTIVVASDHPPPGAAPAALAADPGADQRPDRPAPQPALTDGDVPAAAADAPAAGQAGDGTMERGANGRPQWPSLAEAPREVLLYAKGCGEWYAAEPWADGRTFGVDGADRSCSVQWTPAGDVVAIERADLGDSVALTGRDGKMSRVSLTGLRVVGPLAVGPDTILACGRGNSSDALYRWPSGASVPTYWHGGCLPALARDGSLAWSAVVPPAVAGDPPGAAVSVQRPGRQARTLATWPRSELRSVAWTGDGRRVVVVIAVPGGMRAVSLDPDGDARFVLARLRGGELQAHPSPAGSRVMLTVEPATGAASIESHDADDGHGEWFAPTDGPTDVAWSPSGSRLLISDRAGWSFVEPGSGILRLRMQRLGDAPAWCCPEPLAG